MVVSELTSLTCLDLTFNQLDGRLIFLVCLGPDYNPALGAACVLELTRAVYDCPTREERMPHHCFATCRISSSALLTHDARKWGAYVVWSPRLFQSMKYDTQMHEELRPSACEDMDSEGHLQR